MAELSRRVFLKLSVVSSWLTILAHHKPGHQQGSTTTTTTSTTTTTIPPTTTTIPPTTTTVAPTTTTLSGSDPYWDIYTELYGVAA